MVLASWDGRRGITGCLGGAITQRAHAEQEGRAGAIKYPTQTRIAGGAAHTAPHRHKNMLGHQSTAPRGTGHLRIVREFLKHSPSQVPIPLTSGPWHHAQYPPSAQDMRQDGLDAKIGEIDVRVHRVSFRGRFALMAVLIMALVVSTVLGARAAVPSRDLHAAGAHESEYRL